MGPRTEGPHIDPEPEDGVSDGRVIGSEVEQRRWAGRSAWTWDVRGVPDMFATVGAARSVEVGCVSEPEADGKEIIPPGSAGAKMRGEVEKRV